MQNYPTNPKDLVAALLKEHNSFCNEQYKEAEDVLKSIIPHTIKQYQEGFISWQQVLQIAKGVVK